VRILVGGHRLVDGAYASGSFYAPTVLANVTSGMSVAQEETLDLSPLSLFSRRRMKSLSVQTVVLTDWQLTFILTI